MKDKSIIFRVTPEEFDKIREEALKYHFKSVSEFCRFLTLNPKTISTDIRTTFSVRLSA